MFIYLNEIFKVYSNMKILYFILLYYTFIYYIYNVIYNMYTFYIFKDIKIYLNVEEYDLLTHSKAEFILHRTRQKDLFIYWPLGWKNASLRRILAQ